MTRTDVTIPMWAALDSDLSFKARGLLLAIVARGPRAKNSIVELMSVTQDGRDSVRTGIAELQAAGYLIREQERHDGILDGVRYVTDLSYRPDRHSGGE